MIMNAMNQIKLIAPRERTSLEKSSIKVELFGLLLPFSLRSRSGALTDFISVFSHDLVEKYNDVIPHR